MVVALLLALCLIPASLARVTSFTPDNTVQCLADPSLPCDKDRSCSYHSYHPSCLSAPIPYRSLSHDRVSCCFKCCHMHFTQLNKLNTNRTAFEENQIHIPNFNLAAIGDDSNLLMSNSRLYQMSHSVKIGSFNSHTRSPFLVFPSYKITSFKDFNTTVYDHTSRNTKRAIFIDLEGKCVPRDNLLQVASKLSGQGIHMVSMMFTKHLPCPPAPLNHTKRRLRELRITTKNKKSKTPYADSHPGQSRPRLNSRALHHVHALIPYGVRSTLAASKIKTHHIVNPSQERSILLDCTCANQHPSGHKLILEYPELQRMCSFQSNVPHALEDDTDEFNSTQMTDMANYYRVLTSVKFILTPVDGEEQSFCEWEGLAFGAIPIIQSTQMKAELKALYRDLPIHVVQSFKNMDKLYMSQLFKTYQDNLTSKNSKYSFSRLFHPHWLGIMKNNFVYGKPAQRPWRRVDIAYKKMKVESCSYERSKLSMADSVLDQNSPYVIDRETNLPDRFRGMVPKKKTKRSFTSFHHSRSLTESRDGRQMTNGEEKSNNTNLIELVLPRCCENGLYELQWLQEILSATEPGAVAVSIYYKCLECLPASLAYEWLGQKGTMFESDYNKKHNFTTGSKRITLLDDSELVSFGADRVKQYPLFDRIHNGKEVTAYLQYMIGNYDNLPKQVVFLHTSPHAHLHLPLLTKFLKYIVTCNSHGIRPVAFMHLNVHYKGGPWGGCCGKKGKCRESTWNYLFSEYPEMGSDYLHASTYSSAQFVASKGAIERWPVTFWKKMLKAINGENDLAGCPHSSDPNVPSWGGHQLTGQYERMWHIIFGQKKGQQIRRKDTSLPHILRLDCIDDECKSGAL